MLLEVNSRKETPELRAGMFRLLAQVQTMIVGFGALLTLGSGVMWSMSMAQDTGVDGAAATVGTWIMVGTGLVGGVLVLLVVVPTAVKLGGLAVTTKDGAMLPAFEYYRRRQTVVSSVAGALAVLSLFAGVAF
jgi:hypothetical protein